jgi:hypothetical protein
MKELELMLLEVDAMDSSSSNLRKIGNIKKMVS